MKKNNLNLFKKVFSTSFFSIFNAKELHEDSSLDDFTLFMFIKL